MIGRRDSAARTLQWLVDEVVLAVDNPHCRSVSSSASFEDACRICYDSRQPVIYPCRCKGTMGSIHLSCLERWLEESNRSSCELCGFRFVVERTPRYTVVRSLGLWLFTRQPEHQLFLRSVRVDALRCTIVTPLTLASSYVCIVAADFYSTNNYDNFPPARWTTCSLLAMMALLVLSYFVWVYMTVQYHQRVWFYWWQKSSVVKLKHHRTAHASKNPPRRSHGISPV